MNGPHPLDHPFDPNLILRKKRALKRELTAQTPQLRRRIAVLGGPTTAELVDVLELFLLRAGIAPEFYQSEYNKFGEDALFGNPELDAFKPELVILFTTQASLRRWPEPAEPVGSARDLLASELDRFRSYWDALAARHGCLIIQNNFDEPSLRNFGNMDAWDERGRVHFTRELNQRFAAEARGRQGLLLHDLARVAACFGLDRWHDQRLYFMGKYGMAMEAVPYAAHSLAALIKASLGRSSKALVLDLDNTLWGGVIGDDGVSGIQLGQETPQGEAHSALQEYARLLRQRGVILAVASKNEPANAQEGFSHPDTVLKLEDFASFKANWDPKHENLIAMAAELSLGLDSLVFVDDNPVERAIVREGAPSVSVPEVGDEPSAYPVILDRAGYFETVALTEDDLKRAGQYAANAQRDISRAHFKDYGEFLKSLDMEGEVGPFTDLYLDRITQLTNKTNQFNLTTRRYSEAEMRAVMEDSSKIARYGRLKDRYGDNGLVSVVIGEIQGDSLDLVLWLMSCRVLKRGMEHAMFDAVSAAAREQGLKRLVGRYLPSPKNAMVKDFYAGLGFTFAADLDNGGSQWSLDLDGRAEPMNRHIRLKP
jgi:FkbH-like protein